MLEGKVGRKRLDDRYKKLTELKLSKRKRQETEKFFGTWLFSFRKLTQYDIVLMMLEKLEVVSRILTSLAVSHREDHNQGTYWRHLNFPHPAPETKENFIRKGYWHWKKVSIGIVKICIISKELRIRRSRIIKVLSRRNTK